MATYFITGCSRGIGLEMIKQLASRPDSAVQSIFATARSQQTPEQLGEIVKNDKRVHFVQLDVEDSTSIKKAVTATQKQLGDRGLDILINNAGVLHQDSGRSLGMDSLESTLRTNVIAVQRVTAAFLPLLRTGQKKQIINISSTVGSIGMVEEFARSPWTAYKVSKAALNMLTVQLSMDLKSEGFTVVAVSPGWLKTDLGLCNIRTDGHY